jgi:hypothetical protein
MADVPRGSVRDYLRSFPDVCAIYIGNDGRAHVTCNLASLHNVPAVAWTTPAGARRIAAHLNAADRQPDSAAIIAGAAAIGVPVTSHAALLARVDAAVGKVDAALNAAKRDGLLRFFNQAYAERRRAGGCMPYAAAYRRLRAIVLRRIANGFNFQPGDRSLIAEVFGGLADTPGGAAALAKKKGETLDGLHY